MKRRETNNMDFYLLEKERSSLSEGQELMLKAMGILRENMGSSPMLSLGRVVARSFLSPMEGVVPGGRVRLGEAAGLGTTMVTVTVTG